MTRVVITGGSGKVSRASIKELLQYGYEVWNLDVAPPREELCRFTRIDFTDFGQVLEALSDCDAENLSPKSLGQSSHGYVTLAR